MTTIDIHTLTNICQVAADRFRSNADEFRKLIDYKPTPEHEKAGVWQIDMTPHGEGARRLAQQFDLQAKEAEEYAAAFANADNIEVIYESA
ncbi:hypothetical protein [Mesorhizobium sp. M7A.F.Ca.MR.362.00.0.0]|uniref:hypothetical protein n=1 Tax=Mesorhizobium sp. M7A.F.Ca.MR.362.00.0.0 TaxID=2496779 RepID=UPI000FD4C32C|nr:hypothetical protein [Mesorhizobium sp. M7A.F.Ca.MR.362.00.0.0]RUU76132.1 hypothetical protein EOC06_28150 [Mesorhizobium sp. M7A.F.Ca.MR.362.00.0.0]RWN95394.1 MAG: hypothetical protein EOS05_11415 [Mesorhizobium sp.]